jgi:hypothetical protein
LPSDIIFYRTGREFVAWQRLDESVDASLAAQGNKDAAQDAKPGSWVILEKSSSDEPRKLNEPDFDRVYVLGYDKERREHYTAYRGPDVKGFLPLKVEGRGDNKAFTVRVQAEDGQTKEVQYKVTKDDKGMLKVTPPFEAKERKRK